MGRAADEYPSVYSNAASRKIHSAEYREFRTSWALQAALFEMADEKPSEIERLRQGYLSDFMQMLTFKIQRAHADEVEDQFQENRRKLGKGGK